MYKYSEGWEHPLTPHPSPQRLRVRWKGLEWYFGKLGVLECYNVIILFKDSEVAQRNGVKPRRAISTVLGHFWERYTRFSCSSSNPPPQTLGQPPPPPGSCCCCFRLWKPGVQAAVSIKTVRQHGSVFISPVPRVNLANFTSGVTFTPLATCLPVLHSG